MKSQLGVLFRFEIHRILRARGVVISGLVIPAITLLVVPVTLGYVFSRATPADVGAVASATVTTLLYPPLVLLSGLAVPTSLALHTLLGDRERRATDLYLQLPVPLTALVRAKWLAAAASSTLLTLPWLMAGVLLLWIVSAVDLPLAAALLLLLVTAVAFSSTLCSLVAVVSRDFRTATNIGGLLTGAIFITIAIGLGGMRSAGAAAAAALILLGATALLYLPLRQVRIARRYLA